MDGWIGESVREVEAKDRGETCLGAGADLLQPPSSSSMRMRLRFSAAIWLHMAADLVFAGSALTTFMILASTSLSARTISVDAILTDARCGIGIDRPLTSELPHGIHSG